MDSLPLESFMKILQFLRAKDLSRAQLVCSQWNEIICSNLCDSLYWRPIVLARFPGEVLEDTTYIGGTTWRERLKQLLR